MLLRVLLIRRANGWDAWDGGKLLLVGTRANDYDIFLHSVDLHARTQKVLSV